MTLEGEHLELRQRVYSNTKRWNDAGLLHDDNYHNNSGYLWWLLRGKNHEYFRPGSLLTDNEIKLCEALAGPNGWAVHQMLLAQMDREPFRP